MKPMKFVAFLIFVAATSVPAVAQSLSDATNPMPIGLREAIELSLRNNNELLVSRNDREIQRNSLRSARGVYDGTISLTPRYTNSIQPQPSTLGGADLSGTTRNREFRFDTSFRQSIATGGDLSVSFGTTRSETSSIFSQLNPNYLSTLGINFNQPLFKNRGIDPSRRAIRIQRKRIDQSIEELRSSTMDVVTRVQRAYWDLVFALRDEQNRNSNLELSKENLKLVEAKIAAGTASPLQRAEVETELANREVELLSARQQRAVAENLLKQLVLSDVNDPIWSRTLVPVDRPDVDSKGPTLAVAQAEALKNRPDIRSIEIQQEVALINQEFSKNQAQVQIDVNGSYTLVGLSGNVVGIPGSIPERFSGGYGQSFSNLFKNETRVVSGGVTITFPVRRGALDADIANAALEKSQVEARTRSLRQLVTSEVRNAIQSLETAQQSVTAARRARENAELQFDGEKKLFDVGRSTQFLLFQRENALTNSRNLEIRAETNYSKALAELHRVTGTTLTVHQISID